MEKIIFKQSSPTSNIEFCSNNNVTTDKSIILKAFEYVKAINNNSKFNINQYDEKNVVLENKDYSITFENFSQIYASLDSGSKEKECLDFIAEELNKKYIIKDDVVHEVYDLEPILKTNNNVPKATRSYDNRKFKIVLSASLIAAVMGASMFLKANDDINQRKSYIKNANNSNSILTEEQEKEKAAIEDKEDVEYKKFLDSYFINDENLIVDSEQFHYNDSKNKEKKVNDEKFQNTKNNYFNIISKYSKIYGVDENLMLAIATQERGAHSEEIDQGNGIGLFQANLDAWNMKEITAYNFETNEYETEFVTEEKLKSLDFNVKFGCMSFQNNLNYANYNIPVAIQMYNYGIGNMNLMFDYMANEQNCQITDFYNDPSNLSWINYTTFVNGGDKSRGDDEYLKHVMNYVDENQILNCKLPKGGIASMPASYIKEKIIKLDNMDENQIKL